MIDFEPTAEQTALRERIIRFAGESLEGDVVARDRRCEFSRGGWKACAAAGLTGLPAPVEHGGGGLDCVSTALACEAFGSACTDGGLAFSVFAHLFTCVVPIAKHGTPAQKSRYLPGLCDGSLIGANATSEPGAGSDIFAMTTRAVREGSGFRLTGEKTFCSNAPVAGVFVVFAVTDPGAGASGRLSAFLVDAGAPGLRVGEPVEKSGLRTSPMADVSLDGVDVGEDALLGGLGGGAAVFGHAMNWERICLFAGQVGVMQRLLDRAVGHAGERNQHGRAIGKFQAVSHRLADRKIDLEAARLLVLNAAWRLDRRRGAAMSASIAKTFTSEAFVRTAADVLKTFGGHGYLTNNEIERAHRDSIAGTIYSGTNDMQREIIARMLGL